MTALAAGVIDPGEIKMRAEYRFNSYFIIAPRGVTLRDLFGAEAWSAVAEWEKGIPPEKKLRQFDIFRMRAADGAFDVQATIVGRRKDGTPLLQLWPRQPARVEALEPERLASSIPPIPKTRDDAFAALGLHKDADAELIAKTVSALRASWHPDRATGPADKALRHERATAVNVAYEILTGKRKAA